jgi:hypothetical protein
MFPPYQILPAAEEKKERISRAFEKAGSAVQLC